MKTSQDYANKFFAKNPDANEAHVALGKAFSDKLTAQHFLRGVYGEKVETFKRTPAGAEVAVEEVADTTDGDEIETPETPAPVVTETPAAETIETPEPVVTETPAAEGLIEKAGEVSVEKEKPGRGSKAVSAKNK